MEGGGEGRSGVELTAAFEAEVSRFVFCYYSRNRRTNEASSLVAFCCLSSFTNDVVLTQHRHNICIYLENI